MRLWRAIKYCLISNTVLFLLYTFHQSLTSSIFDYEEEPFSHLHKREIVANINGTSGLNPSRNKSNNNIPMKKKNHVFSSRLNNSQGRKQGKNAKGENTVKIMDKECDKKKTTGDKELKVVVGFVDKSGKRRMKRDAEESGINSGNKDQHNREFLRNKRAKKGSDDGKFGAKGHKGEKRDMNKRNKGGQKESKEDSEVVDKRNKNRKKGSKSEDNGKNDRMQKGKNGTDTRGKPKIELKFDSTDTDTDTHSMVIRSLNTDFYD